MLLPLNPQVEKRTATTLLDKFSLFFLHRIEYYDGQRYMPDFHFLMYVGK